MMLTARLLCYATFTPLISNCFASINQTLEHLSEASVPLSTNCFTLQKRQAICLMKCGRFVLGQKEEQRSSKCPFCSLFANQSWSLTELEAVCWILLTSGFFFLLNVAISSFGPFMSLISSKNTFFPWLLS